MQLTTADDFRHIWAIAGVFIQISCLSFSWQGPISKIKAVLKCKLHKQPNRTRNICTAQATDNIRLYTFDASVCTSVDRSIVWSATAFRSYQCDTNSKQIFKISVNYWLLIFWNSLSPSLLIDAFLFLFYCFFLISNCCVVFLFTQVDFSWILSHKEKIVRIVKHVVTQAVAVIVDLFFCCRMFVSIIYATYARTDEQTMQNMRNPTHFAHLLLLSARIDRSNEIYTFSDFDRCPRSIMIQWKIPLNY